MNQHNLIIFIAFVIGFAVGAICVLNDAEKEKQQAIEKYKEDVAKVHDLLFQRMKNYEDLWLTCDANYTVCVSQKISLTAKDSALKALKKEKAKQLRGNN